MLRRSQWRNTLEPAVWAYADCHTCGQMIRWGTPTCPNCGITLDYEELASSVVVNSSIQQAMLSANSIVVVNHQQLYVCMGMLALRIFSGENPIFPRFFNLVQLLVLLPQPLMMGTWLRKYRWTAFVDKECSDATAQMWAGLRWWLPANILNLALLLSGWHVPKEWFDW